MYGLITRLFHLQNKMVTLGDPIGPKTQLDLGMERLMK